MDSLLKNIPLTICYIGDILIDSKGSLEKNKCTLLKILNILENRIMAAKWEKSAFSKKNSEWLGFKIPNTNGWKSRFKKIARNQKKNFRN